jgi:dTMP kinase
MKRAPGTFITFEGLDGCGKTTQVERLAKGLRAEGHEVLVTREPGGTPIGEKIRAVLLDSRTKGMAPSAELALMFASRAQQLEQVIIPALAAGKIVLCDRFTDSSEAYQGGGRQLGSKAVLQLHEALCHGLQPDLTILLLSDIAHVQRARRRENRKKKSGRSDEGRFEQEKTKFFERVLKAYLAIAKREPKRVVKIEASGSIPEIQKEIFSVVQRRIKSK